MTGSHIWTYQYPFSRDTLISAFQRKLLSTNEDVIVAAFRRGISHDKIRYLRLIVDPVTGKHTNSAGGDIYYEGVGFTDSFELLGIIIENHQSMNAFYYDGDLTKPGCPCMYFGTLRLSAASNSRIDVKRRMSRYPTPFTAYQNIPLFIISAGRYFIGANGKDFIVEIN